MVVYFFRHGEADWPDWQGSDEERPLNKKGEKVTRHMAKLLGLLRAEPDMILSSPLPRALDTAKVLSASLGAPLRVEEALCPGSSADVLRPVLKAHEEQEILLVGHQPDFSAILKSLTGVRAKLTKSGVAKVDLDEEFTGKLTWLFPARLAGAMLGRERA